MSNKTVALKEINDTGKHYTDSSTLFSNVINIKNAANKLNTVSGIQILGNKITTEVKLKDTAAITLIQNFHPNWKLYVNGVARSLAEGNFCLLSTKTEPGEYLFEYIYVPSLSRTMVFIYFISWFSLNFISLILWRKELKK